MADPKGFLNTPREAPVRRPVDLRLLADWDTAVTRFCKVMPKDYARVLAVIKTADDLGASDDERDRMIMESARG